MKKEEIQFYDIHSHLHSNFFKEDVGKVLKEMRDKNIWTNTIGVDFEDSQKAVELAQKNENLYATIGIHPVDNKDVDFEEKKFQKLFDENKENIIGVGECGLDYYW